MPICRHDVDISEDVWVGQLPGKSKEVNIFEDLLIGPTPGESDEVNTFEECLIGPLPGGNNGANSNSNGHMGQLKEKEQLVAVGEGPTIAYDVV